MTTYYARIAQSLLAASLTALFSVPSASQASRVLATDAQQQAIELSAARALAVIVQKLDLRGDALDAKAYSAHYDEPVRSDEKEQYASAILRNHSEAHMRELGSILGITSFVDDRDRCVVTIPEACRIGSAAALIAFTPAWIVDRGASIAMKRLTKRAGAPGKEPVEISAWLVKLINDESKWRVVSVSRYWIN